MQTAATMQQSALLSRPSVVPRPSRRAGLTVRAAKPETDPVGPKVSAVEGNALEYAKSMPGVVPPFPNIFDPANLLGNLGSSNTAVRELRRWREAEVTHGRVAMLASLGFIVQEKFIADNNTGPFPHVVGPAINHFQQVEAKGAIFWTPLLLFIGICEGYRVSVGWNTPTSSQFYSLRDDYEPGDLGFDPLGLLPENPAEQADMKTKELNNGRLAMIAIAAFVVQELIERKDIIDQTAEKLGKAV